MRALFPAIVSIAFSATQLWVQNPALAAEKKLIKSTINQDGSNTKVWQETAQNGHIIRSDTTKLHGIIQKTGREIYDRKGLLSSEHTVMDYESNTAMVGITVRDKNGIGSPTKH